MRQGPFHDHRLREEARVRLRGLVTARSHSRLEITTYGSELWQGHSENDLEIHRGLKLAFSDPIAFWATSVLHLLETYSKAIEFGLRAQWRSMSVYQVETLVGALTHSLRETDEFEWLPRIGHAWRMTEEWNNESFLADLGDEYLTFFWRTWA